MGLLLPGVWGEEGTAGLVEVVVNCRFVRAVVDAGGVAAGQGYLSWLAC